MKKAIIFVLAVFMVVSLVACGNGTSTSTNSQNNQGQNAGQDSNNELSPEQEKILASVDAILEHIGNANAAIEKIGSYMQAENFSSALSTISTARDEFQKAVDECGSTAEFSKMKGILQNICSKLGTLSQSSGSDSGIEDKISSTLDGCESYFEEMGKEIENNWVQKYNLSDGSGS